MEKSRENRLRGKGTHFFFVLRVKLKRKRTSTTKIEDQIKNNNTK
jgi:hypothetical protein